MRTVAAQLIPLLASFTLIACGESSAAATSVRVDSLPGGIPRTISSAPVEAGQWRLVMAREIQPPELDPAELIQPNDIAIADDGSVIVAEGRPVHVKVFGPDGAFQRTIGREGSGPGEFRVAFIAIRGDTLVVQDAQNARATTFNWRTGDMLGERRTACCYYFPIGIDAQGRASVRALTVPTDSSLANPQAFVRFPISGSAADTIQVPAGRLGESPKNWLVREGNVVRMGVVVPLQPRAIHSIDPTGGFVTGFSSDFQLVRTREGRDTVAVFGRDWTATPVSATEKDRIVDQRAAELARDNESRIPEAAIRASLDPSFIPDVRPAYEAFWVDRAGRTWVRHMLADTTKVQMDLFDPAGRWLDVIELPTKDWTRSAWAAVALGRTEAAVVLEGDDGRPLVRVYRIEGR